MSVCIDSNLESDLSQTAHKSEQDEIVELEKSRILDDLKSIHSNEKENGIDITSLLLQYLEHTKAKKRPVAGNVWDVDDQAMRHMHMASYRKGPKLRYFFGSGIKCRKPSAKSVHSPDLADRSLHSPCQTTKSAKDIPSGIVSIASHMVPAIITQDVQLTSSGSIVTMASHMPVEAFPTRQLEGLAEHLLVNDVSVEAMERALSGHLRTLTDETLTEEEYREHLQLAATNIIFDVISRAEQDVENFMNRESSDTSTDRSRCLSRESTIMSKDGIKRLAKDLVNNVREKAWQALEAKCGPDFFNDSSAPPQEITEGQTA